MDRIEKIEQYIYDNDIEYIDAKINAKSMIFKDPINGCIIIVINSDNLESTAEKVLALTHECNHHRKNLYYYPYMLRINEGKIEYSVTVDTVNELIPISDLKKFLRDGENRYEISEAFCTPEDFVDEAVRIYRRKGLLPYWCGLPPANRPPASIQENTNEQTPPFRAIRSQSKKRYDIISRIKYSDYVRVMRQPDILNDFETAEELHISIEFLRRARNYFRKKGLPVRQGEIITDWRDWN